MQRPFAGVDICCL